MDVTDVVGAVRRRWRIVISCILLAGAGVGAFLYTRNETLAPTRYRVTVQMLVPGQDPEARGEDTIPESVPQQLLVAQTRLALEPETRTLALEKAGFPDASVSFDASLSESRQEVTLGVTSTDLEIAEAVAPAFADAFSQRRREIVLQDLRDEQARLVNSVVNARAGLAEVENQLRMVFGSNIPNLAPADDGADPNAEAAVGGDVEVIFQNEPEVGFSLLERVELRSRIVSDSQRYAQNVVDARSPSAYTQIIDRPPATTIVPKSSSPAKTVAGILGAGLLLGLGAAVALDRSDRSIRDSKRAAAAFGAPVLSHVPALRRGDEEFAVLLARETDRSEAFRVLAATSVATDRLPRAIMVSSPSGRAHEDVAANFAAALSTLGVRVALVATTPAQSWFLRPFSMPDAGVCTFPELLALAHGGRLNGQLQQKLPRAESLPNLVIVPPGHDAGLELPFNGLPPLLEALTGAGIDVTVIAGPAILENADATIVAWATGAVMWAVELGDATEAEAAEAVARLDLAGVKTFGVTVVEPA